MSVHETVMALNPIRSLETVLIMFVCRAACLRFFQRRSGLRRGRMAEKMPAIDRNQSVSIIFSGKCSVGGLMTDLG